MNTRFLLTFSLTLIIGVAITMGLTTIVSLADENTLIPDSRGFKEIKIEGQTTKDILELPFLVDSNPAKRVTDASTSEVDIEPAKNVSKMGTQPTSQGVKESQVSREADLQNRTEPSPRLLSDHEKLMLFLSLYLQSKRPE